jgi:magnesium-transporting ATPase (P-type)
VGAAKLGLVRDARVGSIYKKIDEVPFSSARKIMVTLHANGAVSGEQQQQQQQQQPVQQEREKEEVETPRGSEPAGTLQPTAVQPSTADGSSAAVQGASAPASQQPEEKSRDDLSTAPDLTPQIRFHEGDESTPKAKPDVPGPGASTTAATSNASARRSAEGEKRVISQPDEPQRQEDGKLSPDIKVLKAAAKLLSSQTAKAGLQVQGDEIVPLATSVLAAPYFSAIKGAPNYVLDSCDRMLSSEGKIVPMTRQQHKEVLAMVDDLSAQALRVIGVAFKPFDELPYQAGEHAAPSKETNAPGTSNKQHPAAADDPERKVSLLCDKCVFVGFVGSIDPARPGVKESIETARGAGIRTIMITGDYLLTAIAIAKSVGLLPLGTEAKGGSARDAKELRLPGSTPQHPRYVSDIQVDDITSNTLVFARATPEDKLVIVRSLQRQGHIVSMTGDGKRKDKEF